MDELNIWRMLVILAGSYMMFSMGELHALRKIRRMLDDETGEEY